MFELRGGTDYLRLDCDVRTGARTVRIVPRFETALSGWSASTRISPLFRLDGFELPAIEDGAKVTLGFLGPIHPGLLPQFGGLSRYLSMGLFNVLTVDLDSSYSKDIETFARERRVPLELWTLRAGVLHQVICHPINVPPAPALPRLDYSPPAAQRAAVREFETLAAALAARADQHAPAFRVDLKRFIAVLEDTLKDDALGAVDRQALLVTANAALSRQCSQAFSGTSRITDTECHFWSHSALGVGIASLGVRNLTRFIEKVLSLQFDIAYRVSRLHFSDPNPSSLLHLRASDAFWGEDFLGGVEPPPEGSEPLPLIPFFSGRDGFRSTRLSVSAPLEAISSSNTASWTLRTLTHEISHTIVEGVLGQVLPHPDDDGALQRAAEIQRGDSARSFAEQLGEMLCYAVAGEGAQDEKGLGQHLRQEWSVLNEVMTHVFDYLYFYGADVEAYVRSLWASWAVIPNIEHRVDEYVLRCLCALYSNNMEREDGRTVTVDALHHALEEVRIAFPDAPYVQNGLRTLEDDKAAWMSRLITWAPAVKFVRYVLYSSSVSSALMRDDAAVGRGAHEGYDMTAGEFRHDDRIDNPLRFAAAYSADREENAVRTAWLLTQLAFANVD